MDEDADWDAEYVYEDRTEGPADREPEDDALDEEDDADARPIDSIVSRSQRLLIRGPAGSGKTTLLQWLGVNAARESMPDALAELDGLVPFLVRLRRYTHADLPSPAGFIDEVARVLEGFLPGGWVEQQLDGGKALVLIDGVDEVAAEDRPHVSKWLHQLIDAFPRARYVVTSRPAAVEEDFDLPAGFDVAELQPMSLTDIGEFIDHWHMASARSLPPGQQTDLLALAPRLREVVRTQSAVRRLATNPLLCAVLCALHSDGHATLPRDRIGLYRVALETLLERRDAARGVVAAQAVPLNADQKQLLLEDLAWWLVTNGYSDAPKDIATSRLAQSLERMPGTLDASEVLDFLLERTGLLREPVTGRIDFVHKTFLEYLAARFATRAHDIGVLVSGAGDDSWDEIVVLAAGVAAPDTRSSLIRGLVDRADREPEVRERLRFLAAACADIAPELDPALRQEISSLLQALVPPRSLSAAISLAGAGEIVLPSLAYRKTLSAAEARASVRVLGLIGTPEALDLLEPYGRDARVTVVREILRQMANFDEIEYATRILADSPLDDGYLAMANASRLGALPYVKGLRRLEIHGQGEPLHIDAIRQCEQLEELSIQAPTGLRSLDELGRKPALTTIRFGSASDLTSLSGIEEMAVADLRIDGAETLDDLAPLTQGDQTLETFMLWDTAVTDFAPLATQQKLRRMAIGAHAIDTLEVFEDLDALANLALSDIEHDLDLSWLALCPALNELYLIDLGGRLTFAPFDRASEGLEYLGIQDCSEFQLEQLFGVGGLSEISVTNPVSHWRLAVPTDLSWTALSLHNVDYVKVEQLPDKLAELDIMSAVGLESLLGVAGLAHLEDLTLVGCPKLADLRPLAECRRLETLTINRLSSEVDLQVLAECPALEVVRTADYADQAEAMGFRVIRGTRRAPSTA